MGAGTGAHHHRLSLETRHTDVLPTAAVIAAAKRQAALRCCVLATERAWPDLGAAHATVELIPYVALEALSELCVDVKRERLARCLGLDPLDAVDELARLKATGSWPADEVTAVLMAIGGGA